MAALMHAFASPPCPLKAPLRILIRNSRTRSPTLFRARTRAVYLAHFDACFFPHATVSSSSLTRSTECPWPIDSATILQRWIFSRWRRVRRVADRSGSIGRRCLEERSTGRVRQSIRTWKIVYRMKCYLQVRWASACRQRQRQRQCWRKRDRNNKGLKRMERMDGTSVPASLSAFEAEPQSGRPPYWLHKQGIS